MAVIVGAVVVGLVVLIILFKLIWRVAEPNEALIISGLGARSKSETGLDSLGFKIVTGKGTAVLPGFQTSRRLRLDSRAGNLEVQCVTQQGIPVHVRGVVIYKVGDDLVSIANAARRFLEQQASMDGAIHELFTGHLRSIIGNLTVEDLILNRERMTSETRMSAADEMSKLGLIVDSLQIQEIEDETGYITNLGRPHAARVASAARIAEAERNQEATRREQETERENASVIRDTEIKKAEYNGQVKQAEQQARQEVILRETRNAELEAERTEKRLESEIRKPADARAYEQVKLAGAQRDERIAYADAAKKEAERKADATRVMGEAEADAIRQKGLAEAEAIKARADALAENTDAVIAQQLAEKWPEIVEAGADVFGNVDNMIVLNGAQGVEDMLAKALTLGGTGLGVARQLLTGINVAGDPAANGHAPAKPVPAADAPKPAAPEEN